MDEAQLSAAKERIAAASEMAKELSKHPRAAELAQLIEKRSREGAQDVIAAADKDRVDGIAGKLFEIINDEGVNNATVLCVAASFIATIILGNDHSGTDEDRGLMLTLRSRVFDLILKSQLAFHVANEANERDAARAQQG